MASAPASTVVANMAPNAIKAPASTANATRLTASSCAFLTPTPSAFSAISAGSIASMP
jgi:hypothetical protein